MKFQNKITYSLRVQTKLQKSMGTKAIWIFTNDANPFRNCAMNQDTVYTFAKDIRDNGINIKLWPMPTDKPDFFFDTSVFFDQVVSGGKAKIAERSQNATISLHFNNVDDMLNDINVNAGLPRKYQTLPLFLPDWIHHIWDPCIMLDLYALIQIKRKPTPILVHQDTMKYVKVTFCLLVLIRKDILSFHHLQLIFILIAINVYSSKI